MTTTSSSRPPRPRTARPAPAGHGGKPAPAGDGREPEPASNGEPAPAGHGGKPRAAGNGGKPAPAGHGGKPRAAGDAGDPAQVGDGRSRAPGAPPAVLRSLTDDAADSLGNTDPPGLPSLGGVLDGVAATFGQGRALVGASRHLAAETARIAVGRSQVTPDPGDWRFQDPAWVQNPAYRRLGQGYLAFCEAVDNLVQQVERSGRSGEKVRFLTQVATSALAPTNTLPGNPTALKRALDTGGASLVRGLGHWAHDVRHNGGMPSTATPGALQVGRDLALTPGAVVDQDEVAELIQYRPSTETVRERPLLVVPPPIGRFYFLDLRPGRSFVEHAVGRGLQTYLLSWRNPTPEQGDWDLDTYARRITDALDVVRTTTGSEDVNVIGFCAGALITSTVLSHLAATGDHRVHSMTFAVTLLDFGQPAPIGAFSSPRLLSLARWNSGRAGVIKARAMSSVFTWLRPNDLVWNYWVNNYLLGEDPPVFDILSWNADGTNLPAALHKQFLDVFEHNVLCTPGALTVLSTPVDLGRITVPTYVAGAVNDHITPWRGTYQTTRLLRGPSEFVLSNAGHVQALVNPPGNPKASYFAGGDLGGDAEAWLESATRHRGSWWEHWSDWVVARSGDERAAPRSLGCEQHPAGEPAPGRYVRDLPPVVAPAAASA